MTAQNDGGILTAMCSDHWLCTTGRAGCYFQTGELGIGGHGADMTDDKWDELDALQDQCGENPESPHKANKLGAEVRFALRAVAIHDAELITVRRSQLEARYAHEPAQNPRPVLRITIRRSQDAPTAATEIRKLGNELAQAIAAELRK